MGPHRSTVLADAKHDEYEDVKKLSSVAHIASSFYENDGVHDGLEVPTEEEKHTLRRVPDNIPWSAYLIAVIELSERLSYYGSQIVFTNFIQQPLPPGSHTGAGGANGQSGALNMGQQASTGLNTFYQFWCYVTPLGGAYIADTYWGRYKTICVSVAIVILGHIIMIISSVPGVIDNGSAIGPFALSLVIMGIGTGGFKANISPLIAEQYKRSKIFIATTKRGERVIVDPALTTAKIYMYFYLFINIGASVGPICMTFAEKYVGYWLAYTLPTIVFLLCPIVLWAGKGRYVTSPPTGSVLKSALRLWRFAARGRWSLNPVELIRMMKADDFWENAKPSKQTGENKPRWMTFDDQWVDEVRRGAKACTVFLWFPIYCEYSASSQEQLGYSLSVNLGLPYNQMTSNLTSQGATLATHGLPNEISSNLDPFALLIFIPVCDLILYPAIRRAGLNFSSLKRITAGFISGAMAMIWAGVVQHYIYKTSPCGYAAGECAPNGVLVTSALSIWIQSGSYVLIAFSEIFASITGLEYAFTKAPKNMRSLVMSIFLLTSAIAAAIGEAFTSISTDPLLVWNYGTMGCIAGFGGILFWWTFRKLDAEEDTLNNLATGHLDAEK